MTTAELNTKVAEFCVGRKKQIVNREWIVNGLNILHIRDYLMGRGSIILEDLDAQIYIAYINGGFLKQNQAVVGLALNDYSLTISIHSREIFINQHTNEGIINEIEKEFKRFIQ